MAIFKKPSIYILIFLIVPLFVHGIDMRDGEKNIIISGVEQYGMNEGLSHSDIQSIFQDSQGFLWIGTGNGLNKFDGYKFTYFAPENLPHNRLLVNNILEGDSGNLWLATDVGLYKFNRYSEIFTDFMNVNKNFNRYYVNDVVKILKYSSSELLIITAAGAYLFDKYNKSYKPLTYKDGQLDVEIDHEIIDAALWKNERLLFITPDNFFYTYNFKNETLTKNPIPREPYVGDHATKFIRELNDTTYLVSGKTISYYLPLNNSLFEIERIKNLKEKEKFDFIEVFEVENDSTVWFTTSNLGMYKYQPNSARTIPIEINQFSSSNTYSKSYTDFLFDQNNILWMGTNNQGLLKFDQHGNNFENYTYLHGNPNSLSSNFVYGLFYDNDSEKLYAGNEDGNIDIISFRDKNISHLNPQSYFPKGKFHIAGDITKDMNSNIWISFYNGGVIRIDVDGKLHHYLPSVNQKNNIFGYSFREIMVDSRNNVWVAGFDEGIQVYNRETDMFERVTDSRRPDDFLTKIWTIYETADGVLWFGSENYGLIKGERHKSNDKAISFAMVSTSSDTIAPFSSGFIRCIYEDQDNLLWVGTAGGGLSVLNRKTGEFNSYSTEHGLPSNIVYAIFADKNNNLWLSTENGISKFNRDSKTFSNYYKSDGIQSNQFYMLSEAKSADGKIFFGGTNGITSFIPEEITKNHELPRVVVTEFKVLNETVLPGDFNGYKILQQPISLTNSIKLPFKYNTFSFEFTSLHFANPEKNKFRYKLEGVEDWVEVGAERRFANYTALSPGNYTFYLQAANNDGVWSAESVKIRINILPPWYMSWYALILYLIILSGSLYFFRMLIQSRQKIKSEIAFERLKAEKIHEMDQSKLRFFTNISHEFRTPLTLMLGPLDKLITENNTNTSENRSFLYGLMKRNTLRLLRLINQVLDTSKLDAGSLKLKVKKSDLTNCLADIYNSFQFVASSKKISYILQKDSDEITGYYDRDKVEKIFYNLLSNAFKFTPSGGSVMVQISKVNYQSKNACEIIVSDSGFGVREEDRQKVFDLFYQSPDNKTTAQTGSGIGLALTKKLVELHKGDISIENIDPSGTLFRVIIPLDPTHYTLGEISNADISEEEHYLNLSLKQPIESELKTHTEKTDSANQDGKDLLLIVEDNSDLRTFMRLIFEENFKVFEASNGKDGLQLAIQIVPDLIISDILMPEMDGIELCEKLKTELSTSHIPVLLLSSKTAEEDMKLGFESGAVEYVTKPFSEKLLKLRIKNLLDFRNQSRKAITGTNEKVNPESFKQLNELDHTFIQEVTKTINENIDNSEFNVEELSERFSLSRSHFYRKLKGMTGKSPNDYIRFIRLQKANKLLKETSLNISEVSYLVGFNDPKYFSRCFKKEFGIVPKAILSE